jgi:uncharacterized LabA/DUF88 family protein
MKPQQNNFAFIEYNNYDRAVIVTGDGDFYCLVEHLLEQEKLRRLLVPNRHKYSSLLRKFARQVSFLNELDGKLGYKKESPHKDETS